MILIDTREGSRHLLDFIDPSRCEPTRLDFDADGSGKLVPCGDAMIVGNGPDDSALSVGVEVKSVSDVLSSISTGRLGGTQVPRMLRVFDVTCLLIYGVCRPGPDNYLQVRKGKMWKRFVLGRRPVPWSYLEGFLLTLQIYAAIRTRKPIFVKQVYDLRECAVWLEVMDRWLEKPWDKHRGLAVFDKSGEIAANPDADPVEEQIARTAASLPAIDWVRGHAAARHFESILEMMNSDPAAWQEIRGIGPVIAREAVTAIRRRKGK